MLGAWRWGRHVGGRLRAKIERCAWLASAACLALRQAGVEPCELVPVVCGASFRYFREFEGRYVRAFKMGNDQA
jgi:hypothetical protein